MEHKSTKHKREMFHPCDVCDKAFKSVKILTKLNQHMSHHYSGHVYDCNGCGKYSGPVLYAKKAFIFQLGLPAKASL